MNYDSINNDNNLDKWNNFYFSKKIPSNQKDKLINEVININEQSKIFDCLSICNSYEMGFVLPLTDKIKNLIRVENVNYYNLLKYHGSRSFRFTHERDTEEFIIGIRCKDELRYWTPNEKNKLLNLIENAIESI
jgi:hypothetical protein